MLDYCSSNERQDDFVFFEADFDAFEVQMELTWTQMDTNSVRM